MSKETNVPLEFEGEQLEGVFVGRRDAQPRPTVMLIPTVAGVSDLEIGVGRQLVELGYNGFVGCEYNPRAATTDGLGWFKRYAGAKS